MLRDQRTSQDGLLHCASFAYSHREQHQTQSEIAKVSRTVQLENNRNTSSQLKLENFLSAELVQVHNDGSDQTSAFLFEMKKVNLTEESCRERQQ